VARSDDGSCAPRPQTELSPDAPGAVRAQRRRRCPVARRLACAARKCRCRAGPAALGAAGNGSNDALLAHRQSLDGSASAGTDQIEIKRNAAGDEAGSARPPRSLLQGNNADLFEFLEGARQIRFLPPYQRRQFTHRVRPLRNPPKLKLGHWLVPSFYATKKHPLKGLSPYAYTSIEIAYFMHEFDRLWVMTGQLISDIARDWRP
jgi:hypothetical protein